MIFCARSVRIITKAVTRLLREKKRGLPLTERGINMKIITIEEHCADKRILDATAKYGAPSYLTELPEKVRGAYNSMRFTGEKLTDVDTVRFDFMREQKVDVQVLSYTTPVPDTVPAEDAVRICGEANDILAGIVKKYPDRFAAFATLPMAAPEEAARELERCVKEYGFVGALISGTWQGKFYDDPAFFPIFEKAAELDVPISWHPEFPDAKIQKHYYLSGNYPAAVGMQFATAGFGWHLDVGLHITRLVLSGIFDKLPNLKFISGHWGETIPSMLDRMDQIMRPQTTGLNKKISTYFHENIWYTPSGILSKIQLEYTVREFGADHVIWALDYPYVPFDTCSADFLLKANLTDEEKELIAHRNAERIFKLN